MQKKIIAKPNYVEGGTYILDDGMPHGGYVQIVFLINDIFAMVKDTVIVEGEVDYDYEWVVRIDRLKEKK